MTDIVVQDNFLDKEYFKKLQSEILSARFPWYLIAAVKGNEKENEYYPFRADYKMVHIVYLNRQIQSNFWNELNPLFSALDLLAVLRVKINLSKREEKVTEHGMHVDLKNVPENALTSILYMNTNNGYTKFENGEKVESVENRLITFPNSFKHTGTTNSCDAIYRCVMNIDWIKREQD